MENSVPRPPVVTVDVLAGSAHHVRDQGVSHLILLSKNGAERVTVEHDQERPALSYFGTLWLTKTHKTLQDVT